MSRPLTVDGNNPNQVIHVRGDSDSDLQALFAVLNQGQGLSQKPLKTRKLPDSFFKPPEPKGVHSREGSQDSSAGGFPNVAQVGPRGLAISHSRSKSSPAQLPNSLTPITPNHSKNLSEVEDLGAWDPQLGQRYFVNPAWQQQLSVKSLSNQSVNSGPQQATPTLSPSHSLQHSPAVSMQDLGPLPPGWEQGLTAEGEVYFINHVEKATSWFDPRLPKHLQRPGPIKTNVGGIQSLPGTPPQVNSLPQQPPQLPQQQQQPPQANSSISTPQAMSPNPSSQARPRGLPKEQFIQTELQKLMRDKERLQREQDEIRRKEMMLNEMMSQQSLVDTKPPPGFSSSQHQQPLSAMNSAIPTAITKIDPFLGHSSQMDCHARQSSADSGLGGMGTGYSLPRTPEDLLTNVDEMDTSDGVHKLAKRNPASSDFNMNELQSGVGMDMGGLGDSACDTNTGMDSDDLVPSLQEDIGNELLNMHDMDVPKMDNLLWL